MPTVMNKQTVNGKRYELTHVRTLKLNEYRIVKNGQIVEILSGSRIYAYEQACRAMARWVRV